VVEAVLESTWLPQWDAAFLESAHHTVSKGEVAFFSAITPLAGVYPPIILGALVAGLLLRQGHTALCLVWVVGLMGNSILIQGLKTFFQRQRPVFEQPFLVEANYSFPSGHATNSILLYGLLAYVCSRVFFTYRPFHRHLLIWLVTFMGVLIGTSRLVLGVHYPSDVLAGWSVGTAWLALLVLVAEVLRGRFGPPEQLWARLRRVRRAEEGPMTGAPSVSR
jgi:membrane-associated phospholipid phosphatase